MLNVASSPSTSNSNFLINSEENYSLNLHSNSSSKFSAKNKLQKNSGFVQTKVPALNLASTSTVSSRQSLSPLQASANPVIIIHQNNSTSSNVDYLNSYDMSNNTQLTSLTSTSIQSNQKNSPNNTNSMESSSSFSSSTSSSISNSSTINTDTIDNPSLNPSTDSKEDLKYMKGYVNVLKERFTRRSLGSNAFEQFNSSSSESSHDFQSSNKAIRMSISDYQRRKQLISGATTTSKLAASHNDYQRRRSVSPFTNRDLTLNNYGNFTSIPIGCINPSVNASKIAGKYSKEVCTNLELKSIYTKNNAKKQFASSDDLCELNQKSEDIKVKSKLQMTPNSRLIQGSSPSTQTSSPLPILNKHSMSMPQGIASSAEHSSSSKSVVNPQLNQVKKSDAYYKSRRSCNNVNQLIKVSDNYPLSSYSSMSQLNSTNEIIKCTYLNEINKDELPKPNFVSSVKNLFEKQISNNAAQNSHSSISSLSPPQSLLTMNHTNNLVHINENVKNSSTESNKQHKLDQVPSSTEELGNKITRSPKNYTAPQAGNNESLPVQTKIAPILESVSITCVPNVSIAMQQSPEAVIDSLVDRMKHNGTLVYDHTNLINTPETLLKTDLKSKSEIASPLSKSENDQEPPVSLLTKTSPSDTTQPQTTPKHEHTLQTLSFKERKDIFNKQNLIYSSSNKTKFSNESNNLKTSLKENITTSPPSFSSHNKRQKIDTVTSPHRPQRPPPPKIEFKDVNKESNTDDVDIKMENKENTINNLEQDQSKSLNKISEEQRKHSEGKLGDTTNSPNREQKKTDCPSIERDFEKENDIFMQSSLPSATEILNSANEAQQAKNKLKSSGQVKMKTFYGGEVIKDVKSLNLAQPCAMKKASFRLNPTCPPPQHVNNSPQIAAPEFIGACVKLEKSNLSSSNFSTSFPNSGMKRNVNFRVNFKETAETFEYPSFEFLLKEMGIDPMNDPDYQIVPSEISETLSFDSFLPGNMSPTNSPRTDYYDNHGSNFYGNLENEHSNAFDDINTTKFTKGSFTNFKPSWHNMNYELGSIENFEILQPINQNTNSKSNNTDTFITNDILPTKEEDLKRWSSDMDSNILF